MVEDKGKELRKEVNCEDEEDIILCQRELQDEGWSRSRLPVIGLLRSPIVSIRATKRQGPRIVDEEDN